MSQEECGYLDIIDDHTMSQLMVECEMNDQLFEDSQDERITNLQENSDITQENIPNNHEQLNLNKEVSQAPEN
jgi:hypothetical protein